MPRRPPTTGYERLNQADEEEIPDSDSEGDPHDPSSLSAPRYAPINHPPRPNRSGLASPSASKHPYHSTTSPGSASSRPKFRARVGSNAGVDLKAINARLERWADEIASRFKKGRSKHRLGEDQRLEIHHSVFQAPDGVRPVTALDLPGDVHEGVMGRVEFETIVESVRRAIRQEVHPSMISQGSSGSYFARNPDGKIVGVFKPKDEEPYAAGNPKWNKWIHRNLFPCFFGRACLIPNLSYVSEAAAYVLDCQLRTNLVPYTDVVWLSSKAFHYPFWDRRKFRKNKKPLPPKPGSFQVFLKGFKDANVFLREHPWPDQYWSGFRNNDTHRNKRQPRKWTENCRPVRKSPPGEGDYSDGEEESPANSSPGPERFAWTEGLKQNFREELEKLVILDYIMRNTDRGLDNWMVKVDWQTNNVSLVSDPIQLNMTPVPEEQEQSLGPRPVQQMAPQASRASNPYQSQTPMNASTTKQAGNGPQMSLGAIDNSLSWPWKHPDAWRSFPFGWLFLPVDLIGRPFSQKTRDHFLPLLTSSAWWSQTQMALKKVFQLDEDFQERMFAKQIAVMKGQAWNVVEALKQPDHGPLELTRRTKVCVWDDLVDVPIAVPMRATSSELRRNPRVVQSMDDGDIAASAPSNAHHAEDLLGVTGTPADMPHPGRFEIMTPTGDEAQSPIERQMNGSGILGGPPDKTSQDSMERPPMMPKSLVTASYHEPQRPSHRQQRRFSSNTTGPSRVNTSIAQQLHSSSGFEDDDGDLGYATAEGQMGNQRKVIVERLEAVKSRNPVFTWC